MVKAPAFLLLSLALGGCAVAPQAHVASDPAFRPARYAWDGAGEDPNQSRSASAPSRATRVASERDGMQAQDGVEAEAKLNRSLIICRGCLPPQQPREDSRLAKAAN